MQENDINTLISIKNTLDSPKTEAIVRQVAIDNPAREVETSLASFLKHRLNKLQEAVEFEEQVKDAILTRLAEASFTQLIGLLEVVQKNNNIATEKILAPFISQAGGKTVSDVMRESTKNVGNPEQKIYEDTNDKAILQSLAALSQFLELAKKKSSQN